MSKTVGMVGLGIMGSAISRNLTERGWRVIGFNTDAARRNEAAQAGVTIAADTAEVAREAPVIMTSLPSPAAVMDVAGIIARSAPSPRIVVELSTLTIADKLRFEAALSKVGHSRSIVRSAAPARRRSRGICGLCQRRAGGFRAAARDVRRLRHASHYLGAFGNGSKMKFVANLLVADAQRRQRRGHGARHESAGLDPESIVKVIAGRRQFARCSRCARR